MEENEVDHNVNDNADNNLANNIANHPIPRRPCCAEFAFCGCMCFTCLLVVGLALLVAGSYYYAIYDQTGGIDYQATICILENAWYEATSSETYDVKADANFAINGEILHTTMLYNNYADQTDAALISTFLLQFSPNITCYYHPLLAAPIRFPIDVHKTFEIGVGLFVPGLVSTVGSILGIILIIVFAKKQIMIHQRRARRQVELRVEAEQRR